MYLPKNKQMHDAIKKFIKNSKHLSQGMQKSIYSRINYLKNFNKPAINAKFIFLDYLINYSIRLGLFSNPYLDSDFRNSFESRYPYPAKFPFFLAAIGIVALEEYNKKSETRKNNIKYYIKELRSNPKIKIPEKYNTNLEDIET